jgi:hypothetical protein
MLLANQIPAVLACMVMLAPVVAQADDMAVCDQAALKAEAEFGLPSGMLAAIGSVESGGWPWTANIDGVGETYRSKAEAIEALNRVRSPAPADVDVGCFQISLHYHPLAFATITDAFDPNANARYAAQFLMELRDRYGDWDQAVGAYHSGTGTLAVAYRQRVMAQWKGRAPEGASSPVLTTERPRWRVISIAASLQTGLSDHGLPRIVTLGD